jgi:hypothetical protein
VTDAATPSQTGRSPFAAHVRASVHYDNTEEEVDRLIEAIDRLCVSGAIRLVQLRAVHRVRDDQSTAASTTLAMLTTNPISHA